MLPLKDAPFCWHKAQQQSFNILKRTVTEVPVLSFLGNKLSFTLCTNVSVLGINAVLMQTVEGNHFYVIAYASRTVIHRCQTMEILGCDRGGESPTSKAPERRGMLEDLTSKRCSRTQAYASCAQAVGKIRAVTPSDQSESWVRTDCCYGTAQRFQISMPKLSYTSVKNYRILS